MIDKKQAEANRRAAQAQHAPKKKHTSREDRRNAERLGEIAKFNSRTTFKLEYKLSVPPGPLRDDNPVMLAGQIVAENECDMARGILVKIMEQCGYTRPEFGRAVTGMVAEIINPMSMQLRQMIAMQIAQGSGLDVRVQEITACADCGAEQEIVDIMLPDDPDPEGDSEFARQEDQTVHAPECPTHSRLDVDTIVASAEDGVPSAEEIDAACVIPGKEVQWKTGPALLILHPFKYQPLFTPPSQPDDGVIEAETMEITDEDSAKILEFPDVAATGDDDASTEE